MRCHSVGCRAANRFTERRGKFGYFAVGERFRSGDRVSLSLVTTLGESLERNGRNVAYIDMSHAPSVGSTGPLPVFDNPTWVPAEGVTIEIVPVNSPPSGRYEVPPLPAEQVPPKE